MHQERTKFVESLDAAWNSGDLERILTFYSDDFVLESPIVRTRLGIADGLLHGKLSVRRWWARCLEVVPDLRTELLGIIGCADPDRIAYLYRLIYPGASEKPVVSIFQMNQQGLICRETFYCDFPVDTSAA